MTGISRYVSDSELRKIINETDGLDTEATRAGIIELLFKREFLTRNGKHIRATDAGKGLVNSLPNIATYPDITARWETELNAISQREANYQEFMQPLESALRKLVSQSQSEELSQLKGVKTSKKSFKKRRSTKNPKTPKSTPVKKNQKSLALKKHSGAYIPTFDYH